VITITSPQAKTYLHPDFLTLAFSAVDVGPAGIKKMWADLDGTPVTNGQVIDLYTLALGNHTLTVYAMDKAYNQATQSVTFGVEATIQSLTSSVSRFLAEGKIDNTGIANSLTKKLQNAQKSLDKGQLKTAVNQLNAFINEVQAQSGKHIAADAAALLIEDAQWIIK
jgi:diketogulonate reductase-like aldo/keto reductase